MFEKKVYTVVKSIPPGETKSYAWVAQKIGRPRAVRAIGTALKKNPFTIIVPCHRVVRSDGSLGEYALEHTLAEERAWERREEFLLLNPAGQTPVLVAEGYPAVPVAGVIS